MLRKLPNSTRLARIKVRPPVPVCARVYSSDSYGYGSAFRRLFNKARGLWTSDDPAESPIMQTSRKLKEFVATVQQGDASESEKNYVKELVLEIIKPSLHGSALDLKSLAIVAQAVSSDIKMFSDTQLNKIYFTIFRGNSVAAIAADKTIFSMATKIYAALGESFLLTNDQRMSNGVKYFGLLRAAGRIDDSHALLVSLLNNYDQYSLNHSVNEHMKLAISLVRQFDPDLPTLELIADNSPTSMAVFQGSIGILALLSSKGAAVESNPTKFKILVEKFISRHGSSEIPLHSIIMILDTCLELPQDTAELLAFSVVNKYAIPALDAVFDSSEEKLQFYELLILTCTKFNPKLNKEGTLIVEKLNKDYYNYILAKETWDVLCKWDAATGTSSKSVKNMVQSMLDNDLVPDEDTLNAILEGGYRQPQRYSDDIVAHFQTLGVFGDSNTYALLVRRALDKKDAPKALELFEKSVQTYGCSWSNPEKLQILDRLLVEMVADPLFEGPDLFSAYQKIRMFTNKVGYNSKLALLFAQLERPSGFVDDIGRLLLEEFSIDGKPAPVSSMRDAYNGILEKFYTLTDDQAAWRLFGYLNKYVALLPDSYIPIMQKFCSLRRPDAALLVFKSYRLRHKNEDNFPPPGQEMYNVLFREFGAIRYEEGVFQTHAFFKMDLEIENDTSVMNSILYAYSALENRSRCMDTYMDICAFPPGQSVNNETVSIMLREFNNRYDSLAAEEYYSTVFDEHGLTPTPDNVKEYIVTNCSNGLYMRALGIAKHTEEDYGFKPTRDIVEALYNFTLLEDRKKDVKHWAVIEYPEIWAKLEAAGKLKHHLVIPAGDGNYRELPRDLREKVLGELLGPRENFELLEATGSKETLKLLK